MLGWRENNSNITGRMDILLHQCTDVKNVSDCIIKKAYGLSEVVGSAEMGRVKKTPLMDPGFWIPDCTWPKDGYTLNYSSNIADSYERDNLRFSPNRPIRSSSRDVCTMNCLVLHLFHSYQCWYTMIRKKKKKKIISSCPFMQFFVKMVP